jgi:hypothetical protein
MTDVIPDEIQPGGGETTDPGSGAPSEEATLEESPTTAAAAEPAMPPESEARTPMATAAASSPAFSTPVAAAEPAPMAESDAATASPSLESSTSVPAAVGAAPQATAEGGGEWELLLSKVQAWLGSGELQSLWSQARRPLNLLLAAAALVLVLRVYGGLISAIDSLPLVPGLLELVGLIWAVRCGLPRLVQSSEREQLISTLLQRWRSFTGQG